MIYGGSALRRKGTKEEDTAGEGAEQGWISAGVQVQADPLQPLAHQL